MRNRGSKTKTQDLFCQKYSQGIKPGKEVLIQIVTIAHHDRKGFQFSAVAIINKSLKLFEVLLCNRMLKYNNKEALCITKCFIILQFNISF
jgi:hypothetical protein